MRLVARSQEGGGWSLVGVRAALRWVTFLLASGALLLAWMLAPPTGIALGDEVLLLTLAWWVAASQWLPIRIGQGANLYFSSVPLYLLALLFSPPLAMLGVGAGMVAREIGACWRCKNPPSKIAGQAGRWMLLVGLVSYLAQLWSGDARLYAAAAAGILLWLGDVVSCPLVLSTGLGPFRTMQRALASSYMGEPMQYLIGFLILQWVYLGSNLIGLVYIPLVLMSLTLLYLYLRSCEEPQ